MNFQAFQVVYLVMTLTSDCFRLTTVLQNKYSYLHTCINAHPYLFTSAVFPFTMLTSITFWSFYFINKNFIAPLHIFSVIPWYSQIGSHLVIILLPFTEVFLSHHRLPSYKLSFFGVNLVLSANILL